MSLQVVAPCVVVTDEAGAAHHYYEGAVLPAYVKGERAQQLVDAGMVVRSTAPLSASADEQPPAATPADDRRPAQVAPKAEWVAYAVSLGMTEADAEAATKADLIALHPGA